MYEASRMAEIHNTIMERFPQKYQTQVGERGLKLSGNKHYFFFFFFLIYVFYLIQ